MAINPDVPPWDFGFNGLYVPTEFFPTLHWGLLCFALSCSSLGDVLKVVGHMQVQDNSSYTFQSLILSLILPKINAVRQTHRAHVL